MPRAPLSQQGLCWKVTLLEIRGRTGTANRVRARCEQEGNRAREWNTTYRAVKRTLWWTSWMGIPARPPLPATQHTSGTQGQTPCSSTHVKYGWLNRSEPSKAAENDFVVYCWNQGRQHVRTSVAPNSSAVPL